MKTKTFANFIALLALLSFAPLSSPANPGSALSFDGVDDYVDLPDGVWFSGDFTIELWVMTDGVNADRPLFECGNGYASNSITLALVPASGGRARLSLTVGNGNTARSMQSPILWLNASQWVHVAASVNGTYGYLYINGSEEALSSSMFVPPAILRTNIYLGRSKLSGQTQSYAQATMDEVRIWNVARNLGDIQAGMHCSLTGIEPGLLAYWRFNEGDGTTIADATTNHLDGALVNGPAWVASTVPFLPDVETLSATDLTISSATLNGTATPNNEWTSALFEYGTTTNYGNTTPYIDVGSGTTPVAVSNSVSGLLPLTTYHFRAVANNTWGTGYGADASFTTLAKTNAELSDLLLASGNDRLYFSPGFYPSCTNYSFSAENPVVSVEVCATRVDADATLQVRVNDGPFAPLTSGWPNWSDPLPLNVGTNLVEIRVTAQDSLTTQTYGITITRAAAPPPPDATTLSATAITATNAVLHGRVNPHGDSTSAWFVWGTDTNYSLGSGGWTDAGSGTNEVSISAMIPPVLQPATTYHFSVRAQNSAGTTNGADMLFTTLTAPPQVYAYPAQATATNAFLFGAVDPAGETSVAWFQWGLTTNYGTSTLQTNVGNGASWVTVNTTLSGLVPFTVYHFRLVASNRLGVVSSPDKLCIVPPPSVVTEAASQVSSNRAILNAALSPAGWPLYAWFEWGADPAHLTNTAPAYFGNISTNLAFSAPITGLTPLAYYYYRVAASNASFRVEGYLLNFLTALPPTVTTLPATSVGIGNATLNGSVNPGEAPTTAWFEWGETTGYGHTTPPTYVGDDAAPHSYNAFLEDLSASATYHCRSVASNCLGFSYGQDGSFTTLPYSNTYFDFKFTRLTITNYTGYVIDSDALTNNPAYNRDAIRAWSTLWVTNKKTSAFSVGGYVRFALVDQADQPVLVNGSRNYVDVSWNIGLGGGQTTNLQFYAALKPAVRLDPYSLHHIRAECFSGAYTGIQTNTPGNYFLHFTNLVSSDAALNVITRLSNAVPTRSYMVNTVPGKDSVQVRVDYETHRYDNFDNPANPINSIPILFDYHLFDSDGTEIPLQNNSATNNWSSYSYAPGSSNPIRPRVISLSQTLTVQPTPTIQLDPVNRNYYLNVSVSHVDTVGQLPVAGNSVASTPARVLHFNGHLRFDNGQIDTVFTSVANDPVGTVGPGYINSTLAVNANSGVLVGKTSYTYGDGANLPVRLYNDGHAELASGSVSLSFPQPDPAAINNLTYQHDSITLGASSASGDITLMLPTGFGVSTASGGGRRLQVHTLPFAGISLSPSLVPASTGIFSTPGTIYAAEESKPFWLICQNLSWEPGAGRLTLGPPNQVTAEYVRKAEYVRLSTNAPGLNFKRANDAYFRFLKTDSTSVTGSCQVSADTNGMAQLSATLNFDGGQLRSHFPYDTLVLWTNGGRMQITNDLVFTGTNSLLTGVSNLLVNYLASCTSAEGCGSPVTNTLTSSPARRQLLFTVDGGLIGQGSGSNFLAWGAVASMPGSYAHTVRKLTNSVFHMAGSFLRGDNNLLTTEQGPATVLLTGVVADSPNIAERPWYGPYVDNKFFARYPGISFACSENPGCDAISILTGRPTGLYHLKDNSRYYARLGGVTGVHEALTFPSDLTLLGYPCHFDSFGLSYLDNSNLVSSTSGSIFVPEPSNFVLPYKELTFTCPGGLYDAKPAPSGNGFLHLDYWDADIEPLSISFPPPSSDQCNPNAGKLVVGVRAYSTPLDQPLSGFLGFQTNGDLISKSASATSSVPAWVDSRLKVPNQVKLKGPATNSYDFTPVADAYFNSYYPDINRPTNGFLSLVGKLNVPFFEDMKVHLHTGARTNGALENPLYYVMGGWPRAGTTNTDQGWGQGDFFERYDLDPANDGFPRTNTVDQYRNFGSDQYHARAQRLWLDLVGWDYPLEWSPVNLTFKSLHPVTDNLLVIRLTHELTYLDPQSASLDLGVRYAGLPKFSLANMSFNSKNEQVGAASAIKSVVDEYPYRAIIAGNTNLDAVLSPTLDGLLGPVLEQAMTNSVNALYGELFTNYATYWAGRPPTERCQFTNFVHTTLTNYLVGTGTVQLASLPANGLSLHLSNRLSTVLGAIDVFTTQILDRDNSHRHAHAEDLAHNLVANLAPEYQFSVQGLELSYRMEIVGPSLDQNEAFLRSTRNGFAQVCSNLAPAGAITLRLQTDAARPELIQPAMQAAAADIAAFFDGIDYAASNPFVDYSEREMKRRILDKIRDRYLGTSLAAGMQSTIKHAAYDLANDYRDGVDNVFQQINEVIRALVSETLAETDNALLPFLGGLADYIMSGQQSGHALIVGDSLNTLRLDSRWEWLLYKREDPVLGEIGIGPHWNFANHMLIRELHSETMSGCSSFGIDAFEVTTGADGVPLWFWPGLSADIYSKLSFFEVNSVPLPRGLIGGLNLHGSIKNSLVDISEFRGMLAIGADENYISGSADVTLQGINLFGGMFIGRTCDDLKPIEAFAPDVASLLGPTPFTGMFIYGEGWIPIYNYQIGNASLLNVSAGVGLGIFYSAEGPTYGGKMRLGVHGQALNVVEVGGTADLIGVQNNGDFSFSGTGRVYGKLGKCPLCKEFDKHVSFLYHNGSWSVNY